MPKRKLLFVRTKPKPSRAEILALYDRGLGTHAVATELEISEAWRSGGPERLRLSGRSTWCLGANLPQAGERKGSHEQSTAHDGAKNGCAGRKIWRQQRGSTRVTCVVDSRPSCVFSRRRRIDPIA